MSDIVPPKTEEEAQREQAILDIGDIHVLRKSLAFQRYFMRRIREKLDPLEEAILDDDTLTAEEREQKRKQRTLLKEIRDMLDADEFACRSIAEV